MIRDLVELVTETPGATRTVVWDDSGREIDCVALSGKGEPADLRQSVALGAVFPIAHMLDGFDLFFDGSAPTDAELHPEVFDGENWVSVAAGLKRETAGDRLSFFFAPLATRKIRVRHSSIPRVKQLAVLRYMPPMENGKPAWPPEMCSNEFERTMMARDEEPSFESLALHCLPMPVWINTGLKDAGTEQGVNASGVIFHRFRGIHLTVGARKQLAQRLSDAPDTLRRTLIDGYLPGVIVAGQLGAIAVKQTSFAAPGAPSAMFLRIELTHTGDNAFDGTLEVVAGKDPRINVVVGKQDGAMAPTGYGDYPAQPPLNFKDGMLLKDGVVYLAASGACRAGATENSIAFAVTLQPGESSAFDLAAPLDDLSIAAAHILQKCSYENALSACRSYWAKLLEPAMTIETPEPRLNNLYRNVLTQIFMTAQGDILYYGSLPSLYDDALFGIEEGYSMLALTMSGLHADAQRYMDATYLTRNFLKKVERYEEEEMRHQQYRNGLQPMYAVEAYRFNRDRRWIDKHLFLLKECAEWTTANRRTTMTEENRNQSHYGLLQKWAYGGDLSEQLCYPLFPNFACWKGLYETAQVLKELGETDDAEKYFAEAHAYRAAILNAVDRIYRADSNPPFLPLHIEATKPDGGEFFQLFSGILEDLQFFELNDRRAAYLSDFVERDGRTFCQLPRFRCFLGSGGLDAIYGMGHVLTKLYQNKIREFLMGFYAFQAFNMEHSCFGSRESNPIYSSDLHLREPFPAAAFTDPLASSSAVCVLFLRHMLVTEESLGAAQFTGNLLLLYGAPRRWYEAGKTIRIADAPTHFGKIRYTVTSHSSTGRIAATLQIPLGSECKAIKLRLRHPIGMKIKAVIVNAQSHRDFDAEQELITIANPGGEYSIEATY
jgi:hypothetical protein